MPFQRLPEGRVPLVGHREDHRSVRNVCQEHIPEVIGLRQRPRILPQPVAAPDVKGDEPPCVEPRDLRHRLPGQLPDRPRVNQVETQRVAGREDRGVDRSPVSHTCVPAAANSPPTPGPALRAPRSGFGRRRAGAGSRPEGGGRCRPHRSAGSRRDRSTSSIASRARSRSCASCPDRARAAARACRSRGPRGAGRRDPAAHDPCRGARVVRFRAPASRAGPRHASRITEECPASCCGGPSRSSGVASRVARPPLQGREEAVTPRGVATGAPRATGPRGRDVRRTGSRIRATQRAHSAMSSHGLMREM